VIGRVTREEDGRDDERQTSVGDPLPAELVAACQRGDRDAFREIFERYRNRVFTIALHFSSNEAVAADVAQEVFLKLLRSIGEFRGDSKFESWLYRIVVNVCMDEHRKQRRLRTLDELGAREAVAPMAHARREQQQIAEHVQTAVRSLEPDLRLPMLLRYIEDLSYQEIAAALGCSMGTVASRLNRGHKLLARKLAHLKPHVVGGADA
jgi:RNA polymerase sigma-70 factor, ECF subfamily